LQRSSVVTTALIIIFPAHHFMMFRLLNPAFVDLNFPPAELFSSTEPAQSVQSERAADILPLDRSGKFSFIT
jgi:hypothetical protein